MSRINHTVTHTVYLGQHGIGDKLVIGTAGSIYPTANGAAAVVSDITGGTVINHGSVTGGPDTKNDRLGGTGVELQAQGTVSNTGAVTGGFGGNYFVGGVGIDLAAGGVVTNTGGISGGAGGYSGPGGMSGGGNGVDLSGGGTVTNHGAIFGGSGGGYVYDTFTNDGTGGIGVFLGSAATVTNTGVIGGGSGEAQQGLYGDHSGAGGAGVVFAAGGTLTNSGHIYGGSSAYARYYGGNGGNGATLNGAMVTNSGTISGGAGGAAYEGSGGNGGVGIAMTGGTLANQGMIIGGTAAEGYNGGPGRAGAGLTMHGGVAVNTGRIIGGYNAEPGGGFGGAGVYINSGTLTNSGKITGGAGNPYQNYNDGGIGAYLRGGTLVNAGTISGGMASQIEGVADAVQFGAYAATLVVDPGAVFKGDVAGNGTNDTLVLAAGSQAGHLNGLGSQYFGGFTSVTESAGATWTLSGGTDLAGTRLDAAGTLTFTGGTGGDGKVTLDSGSTVTADGSLAATSVVFGAGGNALLALGDPTAVTSTLSGFGAGDTIDLVKLMADGVQFSHGTLSLLEGNSVVATLTLAGHYTSANFTLASDGHGGTDILYVAQEAGVAPPDTVWAKSGFTHEFYWASAHFAGADGSNWGLVAAEHGHFVI